MQCQFTFYHCQRILILFELQLGVSHALPIFTATFVTNALKNLNRMTIVYCSYRYIYFTCFHSLFFKTLANSLNVKIYRYDHGRSSKYLERLNGGITNGDSTLNQSSVNLIFNKTLSNTHVCVLVYYMKNYTQFVGCHVNWCEYRHFSKNPTHVQTFFCHFIGLSNHLILYEFYVLIDVGCYTPRI